MQGEKYYFHVDGSIRGEIEPMIGEIETNIGNSEKLKFPLGWRGLLRIIFDGVGSGGRRVRWQGMVGQEGNGRKPDGGRYHGGQEGQMTGREGMAVGRKA